MKRTRTTVLVAVLSACLFATLTYCAALVHSRNLAKKQRAVAITQVQQSAARVDLLFQELAIAKTAQRSADRSKQALNKAQQQLVEAKSAMRNAQLQAKAARAEQESLRQQLNDLREQQATLLKSLPFQYLTPEDVSIDVRSETRSKSIGDLKHLRQELTRRILGSDVPDPTKMPTAIVPAPFDRYRGVVDAKTLVIVSSGLTFRPLFLDARGDSGCLILYHQGHGGHHSVGRHTIQFFIDQGCDVVAFSMPLLGDNEPLSDGSTSHNELLKRDPSLTAFVEQVIVAINSAHRANSYEYTAMVGISGGGWTTTVAAAIDPRITHSFSVAGSYPMHLRRNWARDMGDDEQTHPDLVGLASYFDLYLLSALEEGRTATLIYNRHDPCCFAGVKQYSFKAQLLAMASDMGIGGLDMLDDISTQEHTISPWALSEMSRRLPRRVLAN